MTDACFTPQEQPMATATSRRAFSIGFPACDRPGERRFPLTPEGGARLVELGFRVNIESGAGNPIHYTDNQFLRGGCDVVTHTDALQSDIVIHTSPLSLPDIRLLRRGTILFTLFSPSMQEPAALRALMERHTIAIALDLIEDTHGNLPFADILAEIDGRTAMAMSASLLADAEHGKGILLGGIAGINPCEVVILGSDIAGCSAARTALGMGAIVKMFDSDVYLLRQAARELGAGLICADMHPRVVSNAIRTADVIIATSACDPLWHLDSDEASTLKRGVLVFDLTNFDRNKRPFPSMQTIDLADASSFKCRRPEGNRVCYVRAGSAVPRTCAMALSNTLVTMLSRIYTCDGMTNALMLQPGLRKAVYLFLGHVVNERVGGIASVRALDINIFLTSLS